MSVSNTILVLDDEPHLLDWLDEYLQAKGYKTRFATNIAEAIDALNASEEYRMLILDLNVPAPGEYTELLKRKGQIYEAYRGLYVAEQARTHGYRGRQVVVYSVHDIEAVRAVTDRIGVTYITKGRPRAFKSEINDILSYDPSIPKA